MYNQNIDTIFNLIKKISPSQYGSLELRGLKLQEEVGELSAEILKTSGFKSSDLSKEEIREKLLLESCDCLIMILDIMTHQKFTDIEIVNMCESQLSKWKNQIKK